MKKIRNISDLRNAQMLIEERRRGLEKELSRDWNDIKSSFSGDRFFPVNFRVYGMKLLAKGLLSGAAPLVRNFGGKIGAGINSWFK